MLMIGAIFIWVILIWFIHHRFQAIVQSVQSKDKQRLFKLQNRLHANFVFQESVKIQKWARWFCVAGVVISLWLKSPVIFGVIVIVYVFFPIIWVKWLEFNRNKKFQKQLLYLIPSVSSMLRAGHGIEKSFAEIKNTVQAPMSDEIELMLKQMQLGAPLEETLEQLMKRFESDNLKMFAHAIIISRKLGSSLSEAMDNITQNILEKEKLKSQINALTSQGKMQSYIAACMPFLMGIVLNFISPGYFDSFFSSTIGQFSIAYGMISMMVGLLWIYRITHKEYL